MVLNQMGRLLVRREVHQVAAWCFAEAQRLSPGASDGLYESAQLHWQVQDYTTARQQLEQLLLSQPRHVKALNLLGVLSYVEEHYDEAARLAREALTLKPDWAAPHNNLGNALLALNDFEAAEQCFRQALVCDPRYAEAWCNLALLLNRKGKYDDAEQAARSALENKPDFAGAISNLGSILINQGRFAEGVAEYRRAVELQPDLIEAQINLAVAVEEPERLIVAMDHFRRVLEHHPDSYIALMRMAQAHQVLRENDLAEDYVRKVLALKPDALDAHIFLFTITASQGLNRRALEINRKARELGAGQVAGTMGVFNSLYDDQTDDALIYGFAQNLAQRYELELHKLKQKNAAASASEENDHSHTKTVMSYLPLLKRSSARKYRIGYVSKDFAKHSVAFFLEPILKHHDRDRFSIYCYANLFHSDEATERFKKLADVWHDVSLMGDDELEKRVLEDEIDILVDLSGYTAGNRITLFASRSAPVQVTYLGYPATTGMKAIDYRLVDFVTDPQGQSEEFYTEKLWRLPGCFLTYQPFSDAPEVTVAPFVNNGYITFGSFNVINKVTERVVEVWSQILRAVPHSRLMLKSVTFSSARGKAYYQSLFEAQGLGADRIELFNWYPDSNGHLGLYGKIDIALDPFPYNGTTTTCEALWMGVPVITLKGNRHLSRVGTSLLTQLGLTELIADSVDDYVQCAIDLANDFDRLATVRAGMRERMQASPLLDHAGFTRRLEDAYREMIDIAVQAEQQAA